jgi:hypothetical protein
VSLINEILKAAVIQARVVGHDDAVWTGDGQQRKGDIMASETPLFEFVVEPSSSRFEPDDPGWRSQVVALRRALLDVPDSGLRREERPTPGHKAGVEAIILAVGTSGAVTAAVEILRAWLGRDRGRQIRLTYQDGDREVTVHVDGTTVSDAAIGSTMTAALEHLAHRD